MKDVYKSRETDLSEYIDAFPYIDKQKGIMVLINGEIAGLEMVSLRVHINYSMASY